jgi:Mg-chelatase subunit ChlD
VGPGTGSAPGPFGIGGTGGGGAGPRHVVYLLDISGSMAMTEGVFGGQSRLQRAREELDRQLGSLGPGETFSMIAFADGTLLFRPQLVSATAANVQDAERFLDGLTPDGDTDLEDALDAALAMPGVNVVYVITDGVPRTPDHDYTKPKDFDALASRIDNANRQNARVFAIGLLGPNPDGTDESAQASALLEQIASDSGGTFKPISLDDAPQDSGKP